MSICFLEITTPVVTMGRSREGDGAGPRPLIYHENIGFLSNTGPDPLKNRLTTRPVFNVGPSSAYLSETPFNGVSLVGR